MNYAEIISMKEFAKKRAAAKISNALVCFPHDFTVDEIDYFNVLENVNNKNLLAVLSGLGSGLPALMSISLTRCIFFTLHFVNIDKMVCGCLFLIA